MNLPSNKKFKFEISGAYTITADTAGRPDLIAYDIFGSIVYYKAICALNAIRVPTAMRYGIRPQSNLLNNNNTTVEESENWYNYDNSVDGLVSELYVGRKLAIPTLESANEYFKRYGK